MVIILMILSLTCLGFFINSICEEVWTKPGIAIILFAIIGIIITANFEFINPKMVVTAKTVATINVLASDSSDNVQHIGSHSIYTPLSAKIVAKEIVNNNVNFLCIAEDTKDTVIEIYEGTK
jgi:hypothetical protein